MSVIEYTFPNGLKLVYDNKPNTYISAINIFVRVGSNNETENVRGISHFIEHMLFKGTSNISSAKEVSMKFDEIGAYINAYTDKSVTCYTVKCDSTYICRCIHTLSDMLMNSIIDTNEMEKEKHVVLEEVNRAKDDTDYYINDQVYKCLYKGSSLAYPTGGDEVNILAYTREQVIDYINTFYIPSNMVISICSNISIKEVKNCIEKSYLMTNKKHKIDNTKYIVNTNLYKQTEIRLDIIQRDIEQTHIALGFRTTNQYDNDKYVLDLLYTILSGNMSSRLFVNLREKNGLTYNVDIDNELFEFSGGFTIITSLDKNKLVKNGLKKGAIPIIIDTLNTLIEEGVSAIELEKNKGFIKGSITLENENSSSISDYNGRMVLFDYPVFIEIQDLYKIYNNITIDDINRVIQKYFRKEFLCVYLIGDIDDNLQEAIREECSKLLQ